MNEEWRPIPGFSDYEVSNQGRVRAREGRQIWGGPRIGFYTLGEKILRPGIASHGYPTVMLGRGNSRTIHSLVAEAFIGPCPIGCEVRHKDGNRKNPRHVNLCYGTRSENVQDSIEHGTWKNSPQKSVATKDQRYPGWRSRIFGRGVFKEGGTAA